VRVDRQRELLAARMLGHDKPVPWGDGRRRDWHVDPPPQRAARLGPHHPAFNIREPSPVLSPLNAVLLPILFMFCEKAGLPFTTLMRVRIGLFTRGAVDAPHHNPHVDFHEPHYTALYYVNDTDGDTWVFNETYQDVPAQLAPAHVNDGKFTVAGRIAPKKGRMAAFDGRHYHASMHPTDHVSRIVVTYNFR
jgi:hypothetical protein